MSKSRVIDDLLADHTTPKTLCDQLVMVEKIRQFACHRLQLPESGRYLQYADIGRFVVVKNLFASNEFSLTQNRTFRDSSFDIIS